MTSRPLVSIGLPTYNRPEGLRRMVLSLFEQTYSHLEIVVSDNCSTMPEVGKVLADLANQDARVVCFRQETNIGMEPNHKFVLQKARGELFAWVADDDEIPKDYIERCVNRLRDSPQIVLVYTKCDRYLEGQFWYSYDTHSNVGESTFARLRRLLPKGYWGPESFEQYFYGVFRREALLASVWKPGKIPMREALSTFFRLSENGFIDVIDDIVMKKNTTQADREKHEKADFMHRPWLFRWLPRELEEIPPVTIAMLSTILGSKNLDIREKFSLMLQCAKHFAVYIYVFVRRKILIQITRLKLLLRLTRRPF